MSDDPTPSAPPTVTVVMPNRNRRVRACRALLSVARQTHPSVDAILVDDGSTRDMQPVVDLVAALGGRTIANPGPSGAAGARNAAIAAARGDWVAFLDTDDWFAPEKLAAQIALGDGNGGTGDPVDIVGCGLMFHKSGALFGHSQPRIVPGRPLSDFLYADGGLLQTSSLAIRRTALERHRFDPDLPVHQETDLVFRLVDDGAAFAIAEAPLTIMEVQGADRITADPARFEKARAWFVARRDGWSTAARRGFLRVDLAPRAARAGKVLLTARLLVQAAGPAPPARQTVATFSIALLGEARAERWRRRVGALRGEPNRVPSQSPLADLFAADAADAAAIVAGRLDPASAVAARRKGAGNLVTG